MRELARARQPGTSVTESKLEDRFEEILRAGGMELPRRQILVGGTGEIGRCDFAERDLPLVIEINSESFHTTPSDVAADKIRYRALNDAGFTVAVIWEQDLWRRSQGVCSTVDQARQLASKRRSVVIHSPGCPLPDTLAA